MSEFGNLSQCMVDSDAATKTRARRLRGKALAASVAFEAVVIAVVMLWPLATLGVLPAQVVVTPLPPFHGPREAQPVPPQVEHPGSIRPTNNFRPDLPPPVISSHLDRNSDAEPPSFGPSEPIGPGIPDGFRDGGPIQIERPRPQPPAKPVVRNADVMEAMLVHRIEPEYPTLAMTIHLSGTVVLRARIGTDGKVHELETLSGNALLAQSARAAVLQWRYRPTMLNGQAVEVETQITVNFVLNRD